MAFATSSGCTTTLSNFCNCGKFLITVARYLQVEKSWISYKEAKYWDRIVSLFWYLRAYVGSKRYSSVAKHKELCILKIPYSAFLWNVKSWQYWMLVRSSVTCFVHIIQMKRHQTNGSNFAFRCIYLKQFVRKHNLILLFQYFWEVSIQNIKVLPTYFLNGSLKRLVQPFLAGENLSEASLWLILKYSQWRKHASIKKRAIVSKKGQNQRLALIFKG